MLSLLEFVLQKKVRESRKIDFRNGLYVHAQSRGADKNNDRKLAKEHKNILLNGKINGENETLFLIGKTVRPPAFCNISVLDLSVTEGLDDMCHKS